MVFFVSMWVSWCRCIFYVWCVGVVGLFSFCFVGLGVVVFFGGVCGGR